MEGLTHSIQFFGIHLDSKLTRQNHADPWERCVLKTNICWGNGPIVFIKLGNLLTAKKSHTYCIEPQLSLWLSLGFFKYENVTFPSCYLLQCLLFLKKGSLNFSTHKEMLNYSIRNGDNFVGNFINFLLTLLWNY